MASALYENLFISLTPLKKGRLFMARLALLEEHGPQLKRPYADFLRDKIYELRFKISKRQIRILYFFAQDKKIVLTNALIKKTTQVPKNEIDRAIRYRNNYLIKHGEKP